MTRTTVFRMVLAIVALPVASVPFQAAHFYGYNRDNGSIVSSGLERTYLLHASARHDPAKPTPLVMSFHGAGLWGVAQRDMSRWDEVADDEGFIVVYPSAVGGRGVRAWRVEPGERDGRDNRFITELIDTLRAKYNIDPMRIYANGLSNGGGMSFGHTWPGGGPHPAWFVGKMTHSIEASRIMWRFFYDHPFRR